MALRLTQPLTKMVILCCYIDGDSYTFLVTGSLTKEHKITKKKLKNETVYVVPSATTAFRNNASEI
jgi:hypothetical protein